MPPDLDAQPPAAGQTPALPGLLRSPVLFDSFALQAQLLARGFDIVAYPRQIVTVPAAGPQVPRMSFVHGVPEASTLAAVTYAQDKRMRRALLQRAGLVVPPGAVFAYRDLEDALAYARTLGFPLAIKEAVGENFVEQIPGLTRMGRLKAALRYMRRRLATKENSASSATRSAYSLTMLMEAVDDDDSGEKLAAEGTEILFERESEGSYLRFVVVAGRVEAILLFPGGPASVVSDQLRLKKPPRPVVPATEKTRAAAKDGGPATVHRGYADLAVRAAAAIPGLAAASVDMVVASRQQRPRDDNHAIVELSERLRLDMLAQADPVLARRVAQRVLQLELQRTGRPRPPRQSRLRADLRLESVPAAPRFLPVLESAASTLDLRLRATISDAAAGEVTARLRGSPEAVAELTEAAMAGLIDGQFPRLAELRQRRKTV